MKNNKGFLSQPSRALAVGFAGLILLGGILLSLPVASASGQPTDFLTALFTSTSAVCVTGLVVVDTGTYWSTFGQVVIISLIQVGGLGFMTMAVLFWLILGRKVTFRERLLIQQSLNVIDLSGIIKLAKQVIVLTLTIQIFIATLLAVRFVPELGLQKGIAFSLFHAVSGFNNAGFDLFGDFRSLTQYTADPIVNFAIGLDIILGGIGFTVMTDAIRYRKRKKISLHSKLALYITAILLLFGMVVFLLLEFNNTLASLSFGGKLWASWFQSVTPRTAGFNTIDLTAMRPVTLFFIILLMFIGASPGSTGGGVKTTTFGIVVLALISLARGKEDAEVFYRRISKEQVYKGLGIILLAMGWIIFATLLLGAVEKADFLKILFEVVSALATVGLSAGLTPTLSDFGQVVIMFTMFLGRLGPLTVAYALATKQQRKQQFRYPEERIIIG
ncbi:potassium uptake protein, TrkH family [Desulforamulus reducens MI-1]|uniref:Potassium uptake protein, TrkH family n=1 Tax=Desulforamulus reducens (strain ATCC BAA-1160 / DSM 100696 / MI-1) TaxID=349161 RepID=A4J4Z1_DESRM|nr:TrkH family potassium uptake protein [Desulforamulus reducens]ABO50144.1 potassium uptake protein, TrkH family [Desulforamulus reducens MI-1]